MPDRTRSLAWRERKPHERSHHRFGRNDPAFPARLVLTVSFVVSPETGLIASVASVMRSIIARLIPASGYQDATTSPSAPCASSLRMPASIAARTRHS